MAEKVKKILIANRGEIACRIMRTCARMNIGVVAVYSDADANALHVRYAKSLGAATVRLGPGPAAESYLLADALLKAAGDTKADAIHPGYGFLSERSSFAKAVIDQGLVWIGPKPETIDLLGNKVASKIAAEKAKVPTAAWAKIEEFDEKKILSSAKRVGFPLLFKAAAGGGGRGMRLVHEESKLMELAKAATREAQSFFGSGEIFLEAYQDSARHVEVQVLGDQFGDVIVLGERDCSAQRRHQKVIEESPAPKLDEKLRQALHEAAASLAKSVKYENAGTLEFMVNTKNEPLFLEMNTRLQVEHPVTEIVWGLDLVEAQIRVARGESAKNLKAEIFSKPRGHAMEVRLYAEDPAKQFMPSPGKIKKLKFAETHAGVRVDTGYEEGDEVPLFYDAMLAKIISSGETREIARNNLLRALEETIVGGVVTNKLFLRDILNHPDFIDFKIDTKWIERIFPDWKPTLKRNALKTITANQGEPLAPTPSPYLYFAMPPDVRAQKYPRFFDHDTTAIEDTEFDQMLETQKFSTKLLAENPGKVLTVNVKAEQSVEKGAVLVVCESMKMEFSYTALAAAKVKAVHVKPNQVIAAGTLLVEFHS